MRNVDTFLFENQKAKCKVEIVGDGAFHIAITEDEFFVNPCLTTFTEKIVGRTLDYDYKCRIAENLYIKLNDNFSRIQLLQKSKMWEVLFEIENVDLHLKDINGDVCQGNSFSVIKEKSEKFYGLGQHQENILNYNNTKVKVYHDYKAKGGEVIGIPYLYSSKGYGLINNTLAQSSVDFTDSVSYTWTTDWTKDFSVFLFLGRPKEIYANLAEVIGHTPMPLKSALGYIQGKQRYESQREILEVAQKYKDRNYPIDMLVVEGSYWKTLGDMSMDQELWPDPKSMNDDLKDKGMDTMISVYPRFVKESTYYDELERKDWFMKDENGNTVYKTDENQHGALIDTTNEECAAWYWDAIYKNLGKCGFSAWSTEENEPSLWPYDYTLNAGKGYEIFNLYPFTHAKSIYDGHRKEYETRCLILSRSAYLGSQRFGTQFWSSDIYPAWDVLEKQITTAINFCASGMGYWSSNIGGGQALPTDIVTSKEYAELYIRWFQFSVFCPVLRAHGARDENEIWSYGIMAEYILKNQLKLRYELMPYIYSTAYELYKNGTPMLRGLFLEFPDDEETLEIKNQYMFGESLLVVPIVKPGVTKKEIYFPKGSVWYDFYSRDVYIGGSRSIIDVSIEHIPVFVRGNHMLPLGSKVKNTKENPDILEINVYGDRVNPFFLYEDDGRTYDYEIGIYKCYRIEYKNSKISIFDNETNKQLRDELPWKIKSQHR